MAFLPNMLYSKYQLLKEPIKKRLADFAAVAEDEYFYELCYCICTPQSKAKSAAVVQKKLKELDFLNNNLNPVDILRDPDNYIRFHNEKAERLMSAKELFPQISDVLHSEISIFEIRDWIIDNFKGMGMKESSHFLRNIGKKGLAILDRHVLKHLLLCEVILEPPRSLNKKKYKDIEFLFTVFSEEISISIDELDLLFWSYETGEILK